MANEARKADLEVGAIIMIDAAVLTGGGLLGQDEPSTPQLPPQCIYGANLPRVCAQYL
jgi:hypothetical protein